jgi:hypothetical protein
MWFAHILASRVGGNEFPRLFLELSDPSLLAKILNSSINQPAIEIPFFISRFPIAFTSLEHPLF